MQLIARLIAGIVIGMLIGLFAPEGLTRALMTFTEIFGELLFFTIPLLILFFISSGIAALPRNSGRLLGRSLLLAYSSTIVAGVLAFLLAALLVPMLTGSGAEAVETNGAQLTPFIEMDVPPVFNVMTALVLAFVFGLGIAATQALTLKTLADEGKAVINELLLRVIIPLLPFYIAGVFAELGATGTVFQTLQTFGVVLLLALALHWIWISGLFLAAAVRSDASPLQLIRNMLPAYFTALGTMSSAATIPVSLQCSKRNGVNEAVADFTVPLFATTHLAGSTITIVSCTVAVMSLQSGLEIPSLFAMLPFIFMLGIVMLAAPGVPGGAVISAVGLLGTMMGFEEAAVALMIALYMAQDSLGTACNVTCDGALALLVSQSGAIGEEGG